MRFVFLIYPNSLPKMKFATPEHTLNYCKSHPSEPTRLGRTQLWVNPFGFGGYRLSNFDLHSEPLLRALAKGCNLIDTSSNYGGGDGTSERIIGETLKTAFQKKIIAREELIIVTKAGYLQGDQNKSWQDLVKIGSHAWHCIHPKFLEDQITRSLERLGLESLDCLLLHNPEYFLHEGGTPDEYYARIEKAFSYLETEVHRGRIQWYGVSSNSFPDPKESREFTSVEILWEIAEKIGGPSHHFAVIQFPLNLYETGAAQENNNSTKTVLEFAQLKNLGTLVNRPLNAYYHDTPIRLADFPDHFKKDTERALSIAFQAAMDHESKLPQPCEVSFQVLAWAHVINQNLEKLSEPSAWQYTLRNKIIPQQKMAIAQLKESPDYQNRYHPWVEQYLPLSENLFSAFTEQLERVASLRSHAISHSLTKNCPALETSHTLSQKALRTLISLPGVHCVLVGMRKNSYVDDVLSSGPRLTPEEAFLTLESVEENP